MPASVHQLNVGRADNTTLLEHFAQYQRARGLSRSTVLRRFYSLRQLGVLAAPVPLVELTPMLVEEWLAGFSSPETRHAYLADVRALFRWACRRGLAAADPTTDFEAMTSRTHLPAPIGDADWRRVVDSATPKVRLVLLFGGLAGLRRAEIAAMRREDCTADQLMVRQGKGGKDRVVAMHPALWTAICGHDVSRGWLFPSRQGGHVQPDTIGEWIRRHFDEHGLHSSLHKARHRFATGLARESNGNPFALRHALGWARLSTAEHYVQYDPAELAQFIRRLSA